MTLEELEKALAPKPRASKGKSDKIWVGISVGGKAAEALVEQMHQAGVNGNRSEWVKGLILADLKKRLAPGKGKVIKAPAEVTP